VVATKLNINLYCLNLNKCVKHALLCDMQEGTLKKINKERNAKTTRNIQQGLPFSIDDVKKQTEDEKVLEAVSTSNN